MSDISDGFFCRVKFVYIEDTSGDIERIRTQATLYNHSLFLRERWTSWPPPLLAKGRLADIPLDETNIEKNSQNSTNSKEMHQPDKS